MALCGLVFILLEFHPKGYFSKHNYKSKYVNKKKGASYNAPFVINRLQFIYSRCVFLRLIFYQQ